MLFDDTLIGVKRFMRDPEVFKLLEDKVMPQICDGKTPKDVLRAWVPGCSTGEELYSIGILFLEGAERAECTAHAQVFGTDIDDRALQIARSGRYTKSVARDLAPQPLARYFHDCDHGYIVDMRLRELCIFARHDLLRDPPLSKLDLISCRNVMIYQDTPLQARLIPLFHYALRPGGFLLLGTAESVTGFEDLFEPVEHKHCVFRRRNTPAPRLDFPTTTPSLVYQDRDAAPPLRRSHAGIDRQIERYLLEQYAPPCVVVNKRFDPVYFSPGTGRFLESPPGVSDVNVLNLARYGLGVHLRAVLEETLRAGKDATRENIHVKDNGADLTLTLRARPIKRQCGTTDFIAVVFEPAQDGTEPLPPPAKRLSPEQEKPLVQPLEDELEHTQRQLQASIQNLNTSNQELRSANEKLMSTNEELQSTAEELDTSREELQSFNEELHFANERLQRTVDELSRANSDIKNLLENTQIAMMFLDRALCVKSFTPKISELYHLRAVDAGRPISDIRAKHDHEALKADIARVLQDANMIERHVHTEREDRQYLLRILPCRTLDGNIEGAVLTFIEVTGLEQAHLEIARLKQIQERRASELEAILAMLPVGIAICANPTGGPIRVNREGARVMGVAEQTDLGWRDKKGRALITVSGDGDAMPPSAALIERALNTAAPVKGESLYITHPDGSQLEVEASAWPVFDDKNRLAGAIGMFIDQSERKHEFELRVAQQSTIARLGIYALSENEVVKVMQRMVDSVTEALDAARAEVWRLDEARGQFVLEVASSRGDKSLQTDDLDLNRDNPPGDTSAPGEPVTVNSAPERQFPYPTYVDQVGMVCSMSVTICAGDQTYGALCVHDREHRQFLPYETNFLQVVADLMGAVTVRKQLEIGHGQDQRRQAFAEAEDRMRQAERLASLGTLAAGIAHEVNNPLNSILMNAELGLISLKQRGARENLMRLLDTIIREAKRGGAITRNVLQFSKADHYTPKGEANLNNLVGHVREHVASVLQKYNVKLDLELDQLLPRLEINQIAMEQAIANLITNAAQSGATRVSLKTEVDEDYVRMTIADNGSGISEGELQHVFDPFYTTRRSKGGSGLGLSLVHRIVSDHNGTVEARTQEGEGTQFMVRLPLSSGRSEGDAS